MPDFYNIRETEVQPTTYSHINGTSEEILDRYCVTELAKGWPVYRDASEWNNYRSIFAEKNAFIWTTWSGGLGIDDFVEVSKRGRARGDFIMHRENGTLADVNPKTKRGIAKMKATITQRFTIEGLQVDVECDCRFIFFTTKETGEWKTQYAKLFYEKDKAIPVDGKNCPTFDKATLAKYPQGYAYLGTAQAMLGHEILQGLPTMNNQGFEDLLGAMDAWMQGSSDVAKMLGVPENYKPKF